MSFTWKWNATATAVKVRYEETGTNNQAAEWTWFYFPKGVTPSSADLAMNANGIDLDVTITDTNGRIWYCKLLNADKMVAEATEKMNEIMYRVL